MPTPFQILYFLVAFYCALRVLHFIICHAIVATRETPASRYRRQVKSLRRKLARAQR